MMLVSACGAHFGFKKNRCVVADLPYRILVVVYTTVAVDFLEHCNRLTPSTANCVKKLFGTVRNAYCIVVFF